LVNAGNTLIATQTFRDRCKFERFAFFVKFVKRWTSAGVNHHGVMAALVVALWFDQVVME